MFDIGFTEILIIATISLLVIGPERLPETVRTVSMWIGRLKRSLRDTRQEIEQQIGADDIRRELHNEEVMQSLAKIRGDMSKTLDEKIALDDELYPPGHGDHDPNNAIDEAEEERLNKPGDESSAPEEKASESQTTADKPTKAPALKQQFDDGRKPAQDKPTSEPGNQ